MSNIEEYLSVQTVQLSVTKPNSNIINPEILLLGRSEDFTEIHRIYFRIDLELINRNNIINSTILSFPVISTLLDGESFMIFIVDSKIDNIRDIFWNSINYRGLFADITDQNLYRNNIIFIEITKYLKEYILEQKPWLEMIIISNEENANQILIKNDLERYKGFDVRCNYYNINNKFSEQDIFIDANDFTVTTKGIERYYFNTVSIFIKNDSDKEIRAIIEDSPNDVNYFQESEGQIISSRELSIIVPYYYSKYFRIKIICDVNKIKAKISIQAELY